jgi:hypothetical protein
LGRGRDLDGIYGVHEMKKNEFSHLGSFSLEIEKLMSWDEEIKDKQRAINELVNFMIDCGTLSLHPTFVDQLLGAHKEEKEERMVSLYHVQHPEYPAWVVAESYGQAVEKWKEANGSPEEPLEEEPESVSVFCTGDDLIL